MGGAERELTARHKDGTQIPASITLSPVHTEDGTLISAAVRDITERLAEQERLRAAEEQFRRSFDGGFKRSSQRWLVEWIVDARPAPRQGSSSRGSCEGGC
jgi:PAS domain-containing protein